MAFEKKLTLTRTKKKKKVLVSMWIGIINRNKTAKRELRRWNYILCSVSIGN